ncbi:Protein NRT1/ PTR FAMILY 4.3 [Zea mays]|uniref:Protein NRT1/ PTR FAMILY 4.4 n=2 Tax=Zea mays TaxID=4577 RepID=A0A1D6E9Z7_MAIZE|nr:protein NRT1/ PTR FAMILY 4.4 [Zea mays]ONM17217.1 Protein NRT1/ PTR FAMILY 4.4 [Zea mays]PWZ41517.1 Protein NRT1/ PTR FAMILY 4.3 [Zea mays]|eukprot:XP_008669378.2 protein NRT1/ PTR FAMILY 4.4 [Zea mays]
MDVEMSCAAPEAAAVPVDWRGRPCRPRRHGGMRAAVFVLGVQAFEIMAIAAVGNNLITYVFGEMHFPLSQAANVVTNFVGTIFLLALLGGFLSDSYLGCFWTMLIFGFVELSGFILLSLQAHLPQLKPAPCDMSSTDGGCEKASGFKSTVFFLALYLVALGSGCLKPNMIAHGADQFDAATPGGANSLPTYFNSAYFSFCAGELVALTALVWVQTHSGMDVGFGVSAVAMAAGLASLVAGAAFYRNKPPQGSIFAPVARVFVAAFTKRKQVCPSSSNSVNAGACEPARLAGNFRHNNKFRFLDKACVPAAPQGPNTKPESAWRLCTVAEVQQAKTLLAVTPIFACTIVFNTVLAQLQTFSVQQGSAMDTALPPGSGSFRIPPASLQAIPYALLLALVPAYELLLVPLMKRLTGTRSGITPLQRIGVGLATLAFSMVAAADVERRRRDAAAEGRQMSVLWIVPQFLVFGVSEMFTAVGLIEFFYKQACAGMQAFLTALTYCSYAFGFYLSSVLVSLVNRVTARHGGAGWLGDNNLNKDRLDLFYWMLAVLSVLNFCCYLLCARWYNAGAQGSDAAASGLVASEVDDRKEII